MGNHKSDCCSGDKKEPKSSCSTEKDSSNDKNQAKTSDSCCSTDSKKTGHKSDCC